MSEYKDAWNIESAGAHGGIIGDLIYLESRTLHNLIFDYYQDEQGSVWFRNRYYLPDGTAVSEEEYLFPEKYRQIKRRG